METEVNVVTAVSTIVGPDTPVREKISWQVQSLGPQDAPAVLVHLLDLPAEDRRLRFGHPVQDGVLENYVTHLRFEADDIFGIYGADMRLIGMAHVAYGATGVPGLGAGEAEIGLSVAPSHRSLGIGRALFQRCAARARVRYVNRLKLAFLVENVAMQKLAHEAGMEVHSSHGDSDAYLVMRAANAADFGIDQPGAPVTLAASVASGAIEILPRQRPAKRQAQARSAAKIRATRRRPAGAHVAIHLSARPVLRQAA
jgi:GNAT superfamily N-acetyltransferase